MHPTVLPLTIGLVSWGRRIDQLHVPLPNECFEYDTKQSGGESSVILEL